MSSSKAKKKFIPEDYQESGIEWLISRPFAGLFWDPGLGKTATVLHAFKYLYEEKHLDSALIVATKRIADKTWPDEVAKWGLRFRISKILGSVAQRDRAIEAEAELYLINYENLAWLCQNWDYTNFGTCMLVCDESTKMKNTQAKRFRALKKRLSEFERRAILTGTPIPNGMHDLFGQLYIVDRGKSLGEYITVFRNRWFHPAGYMGYDWRLNHDAEEQIYDAISPVVHRVSADRLKLPPLIERDIKVSLPAAAMKKYAEMEREFITQTQEGLVVANGAAAASGKLRQIANGAVYAIDDDEADLFDLISNENRKIISIHEEKVAALVELLEEHQGRPALIAFEFTHDRLAIEQGLLKSSLRGLLPKKNKAPYVPYIAGGTSDKAANQYIDWWNQGALPILLGHPASVAHGLNLQDTYASVIYYSLTWNMEHYEQFYRRVYRKGQTETTYVFRIVAENTIDEDMVSVLGTKDRNQKALLSAMQRRTDLLAA